MPANTPLLVVAFLENGRRRKSVALSKSSPEQLVRIGFSAELVDTPFRQRQSGQEFLEHLPGHARFFLGPGGFVLSTADLEGRPRLVIEGAGLAIDHEKKSLKTLLPFSAWPAWADSASLAE